MKIRILVLNEDSLKAVTISDERLSRGFGKNRRLVTKADYLQSSRFNRILSLNSMLSEHVLFTLEDIYGSQFKLIPPQSDTTNFDASTYDYTQSTALGITRTLDDAEFLESFEFYTLGENAFFDCAFISKNFDGIFYFCNQNLTNEIELNDSVIALLSSEACPPTLFFNFSISNSVLNSILHTTEHALNNLNGAIAYSKREQYAQSEFFLHQILPKAAYVSVTSEYNLTALNLYYQKLNELFMSLGVDTINKPRLSLAQYVYANFRRSNYVTSTARNYKFVHDYVKHGFKDDDAFTHADLYLYSTPQLLSEKIEGLKFKVDDTNKSESSQQNEVGESSTGKNIVDKGAKDTRAILNQWRYLSLDPNLHSILGDACSSSMCHHLCNKTCQDESGQILHIALSSRFLAYNPSLGIDLRGVRLIRQVRQAFPHAHLVLFLNDSFYSYLDDIPNIDTIIDAHKDCTLRARAINIGQRPKDMGVAKGEAGSLSVAVCNRVNASLKQHIQAQMFLEYVQQEVEIEQDYNYDGTNILGFNGPNIYDGSFYTSQLKSKIEHVYAQEMVDDCVLNLDYDNFFKSRVDVLISDSTHDLVLAQSNGVCALALRYDENLIESIKLYTPEYIVALMAANFDFELVEPLYMQCNHVASLICKDKEEKAKQAKERYQKYIHSEELSTSSFSFEALKAQHYRLNKNNELALSLEGIISNKATLKEQLYDIAKHYSFYDLEQSLRNYFKSCSVFENELKKIFNPLFRKSMLLPMQHIISSNIEHNSIDKGAHDEESILLEAQQGKRTAQKSNFTFHKRYELQFAFLRYFTLLLQANDITNNDIGATLARSFMELDPDFAINHTQANLDYDGEIKNYWYNTLLHRDRDYLTPLFKPLSLQVLSFGCSRGDEVIDLMRYFNGQNITGIDISKDAISEAKQTLKNLNLLSKQTQRREFEGLYRSVPYYYRGYNSVKLNEYIANVLDFFSHLSDERNHWLKSHYSLEEYLSEFLGNLRGDHALVRHMGALGHITFRHSDFFFEQRDTIFKEVENYIAICKEQNIKAQDKLDFNEDNSLKANLLNNHQQDMGDDSITMHIKSAICIGQQICANRHQDILNIYHNLAQYYDHEKCINTLGLSLPYIKHLVRYDVVTAMTILCRHPETTQLNSAHEIYPLAEFEALLLKIDSIVKRGGLLCVFNANYRLEDTALANKYIRIFPFYPQSKLITLKEILDGQVPQEVVCSLVGSNGDEDYSLLLDRLANKSLTQLALEQFSKLQQLSSSIAMREEEHYLLVPEYLKAMYQNSTMADKIGYTALFDHNENRIMRQDLGSIFLKVLD